MTLKEQIMKLQTYKMYEGEDTVYVERDDVLKALEQEPIIDINNVTHKIAEFFSDWDGDENATMEISVNDMREIVFIYGKQARIERQLKEIRQELCDCEDAISREQAIDAVGNLFEMSEYLHPYPQGKSIRLKDIKEKLKQLPSAQPKPKTGHWIYEKRKRLINETDEGAEYVTDYWCKCSKCGGDFGYRKMTDAFCKYCGAKMNESQESENA